MMKSLFCAIALALAVAAPAIAQPKADEHAAHHPAAADMADGEVRKIDKAGARITIKHGEIKTIDMPPMTMVFQVKQPALLDKVTAGDKIRFMAEKAGTAYVVTAIETAN